MTRLEFADERLLGLVSRLHDALIIAAAQADEARADRAAMKNWAAIPTRAA
jgi:hypothetical protein